MGVWEGIPATYLMRRAPDFILFCLGIRIGFHFHVTAKIMGYECRSALCLHIHESPVNVLQYWYFGHIPRELLGMR